MSPEMTEASIYARGVAEECNIWGLQSQADLSRMILQGVKETGMSLEDYATFMIDQWKLYRKSVADLVFPYQSAARFYQSSIWHDASLWPRRQKGDYERLLERLGSGQIASGFGVN